LLNKVVKIKGVMQEDNEYTPVQEYWYNPDSGVVYDLDLDFPIGKILKEFNIPKRIEKDVYLIEEVIYIPKLKRT
jgi:hypothetical protein